MWVSAVVENYLVFQRLFQKFPGQSENRYSSLNSGIKELKKKSVQYLKGHIIVEYLVAKPLIWSKADGDLVVIETRV